MEKNGIVRYVLVLYFSLAAICLDQHCDAMGKNHNFGARKHLRNASTKIPRRIHALGKFDIDMPLDTSNTDPYVSSPFSMPPYDSLPPNPLPENNPPYCIYPPFTPQQPYTLPSPMGPPSYTVPTLPGPSPPSPQSPPENTPLPNPPTIVPTPPSFAPNPPTGSGFSPPYYEPSPPGFTPNPPYFTPSPPGSVPKSPRYLPPIVYPPPTVPPPPYRAPITTMWCVAKASVPDPIIQEAMNYACASGADCDQIQPNGSCFEPNTLFAHASYAFNSYWQRTKVTGGTCDFGGTGVLVTVDPSYDGCHFVYF